MLGPRMDEGEIGRASAMKDETADASKTQIVRSDRSLDSIQGTQGKASPGRKELPAKTLQWKRSG